MADQLYLTYRLRGFTAHNMLRHFEAVLRRFPVSRLSPKALLRVVPIEEGQPPLVEQSFAGEIRVEDIVQLYKEFQHEDCAYELETFWDLWQFDENWRLAPSKVTLLCQGPRFSGEPGEHVRIEFGIDAQFLPQPHIEGSLLPTRSNIQSLLHLVHDLDNAVVAEQRRLWSESGENFAERLKQALRSLEE